MVTLGAAGAATAAYGWLLLAAIALSVLSWRRLSGRDDRLMLIFVGAMAGAFIGAKLVFLLAEGWLDYGRPGWVARWWTGKSIIGAFLGGYAGVELTKKALHYRAPTGDWFAAVAPLGIMTGRLGCLVHGCCLGRVEPPSWYTLADNSGAERWPAVPVEIAFNALMALVLLILRARRVFPGQHFHLYLVAYGAFRFWHETLRATPRLGALTGYQIGALALIGLGAWGFWRRKNAPEIARGENSPNQDSRFEPLNPERRLQAAAGGLASAALPPEGGVSAEVQVEIIGPPVTAEPAGHSSSARVSGRPSDQPWLAEHGRSSQGSGPPAGAIELRPPPGKAYRPSE